MDTAMEESQFLEAPLLRQADGELKKTKEAGALTEERSYYN